MRDTVITLPVLIIFLTASLETLHRDDMIVLVSQEFNAPLHTKCIEVLCHLTRYIGNNYALARKKGMVHTLIKCGQSKVPDDRTWAIHAFQNLTALESNRVGLSTKTILTVLIISAMPNGLEDQLVAVGALLNL